MTIEWIYEGHAPELRGKYLYVITSYKKLEIWEANYQKKAWINGDGVAYPNLRYNWHKYSYFNPETDLVGKYEVKTPIPEVDTLLCNGNIFCSRQCPYVMTWHDSLKSKCVKGWHKDYFGKTHNNRIEEITKPGPLCPRYQKDRKDVL